MKIIIILFWFAFVAACLSLIPEPAGLWINVAGMALLVGHLLEFFVFNSRIMAKGDTPQTAFLMTMLFGVFYFLF